MLFLFFYTLWPQLVLLDGVLDYNNAHFWQQSPGTVTGTLHIQVAPSANEQKVAHMVRQLLRERGLFVVAVQVEKEPFISSGQKVSYLDTYHINTPPQVYVDIGPQTADVKVI